jgi:hypothetical protein
MATSLEFGRVERLVGQYQFHFLAEERRGARGERGER